MKTLMFFIIVFSCSHGFSQNKGDNTVVIKDNSVGMEKIKMEFIKRGFGIDKSDTAYLSTELFNKSWYGIKYSAVKDGDSIILKGWVKSNVSLMGVKTEGLIIADYKGMNGSANKVAFVDLLTLAKSLSPSAYSIKQ